MIPLRKTFGAAALVAAAAVVLPGCGEAPGMNKRDAGGTPGCTGVCSEDGGFPRDAGTSADGGPQADAGMASVPVVMTLSEARALPADSGMRVLLERVVLHTLDRVERRTEGTQEQVRAWFWVVDPARPTQGLWVHKDWTDPPMGFVPQVGQRVDLTGSIRTESGFEQFHGYRTGLAQVELRLLGTLVVPADNLVPPGFGDADGGGARPNPELLGTRVYVPGPLVVTDPSPRAFRRGPAEPSEPLSTGFEVSGGILVSTRFLSGAGSADGGPGECEALARVFGDGGTGLFPLGLRGVWDTYTFVPCEDGGTGETCVPEPNGGRVPGTESLDGGPGNRFTHVLHPRSCDRDLGSGWDAGRAGSGR
ncbi:hypothetical protein ATI61_102620 [Archangium gephyra]|uniref:Lipoprotein n=1 Tax=Archangium gephyra TaxID=48 RepID=A0AAC8QDL2_9BACT|nr:hypothetical protein [Archangium gephyra]AKJ05561.1 Hypothetical protein AA314_07187 [Archangium gephyra]REG36243.1 hypothetical protein ATI61_102620 [Archangium gephyra]